MSEHDSSMLDALIGEVDAGADAQLQALAELDQDAGLPAAAKASARAEIAEAVEAAKQANQARSVEVLVAARQKAIEIRFNPGTEAEQMRAIDMSAAELASRLKFPPEQIGNELLGALQAGNARAASVSLMTLQLMGESVNRDVVKQVEDALDEQLPHRKQALAIEKAAAAARTKFQIANAAAQARLSMALGKASDAGAWSVAAKVQAMIAAEEAGKPYQDPEGLPTTERFLNKSKVPSAKKDAVGAEIPESAKA